MANQHVAIVAYWKSFPTNLRQKFRGGRNGETMRISLMNSKHHDSLIPLLRPLIPPVIQTRRTWEVLSMPQSRAERGHTTHQLGRGITTASNFTRGGTPQAFTVPRPQPTSSYLSCICQCLLAGSVAFYKVHEDQLPTLSCSFASSRRGAM